MFYDQITDFIFQEDQPQKCEFIFIPGSGYGELAVRAAQLYQKGFAGKIIVSGKYRKRASNLCLKLFNLVRMGGLEPPRPCEH